MRDEATTAPGVTPPGVSPPSLPPATGSPPSGGAAVAQQLGRRNDRILLLAIGGYIVLLSALMISRGVSITPDVLLVALGLAAVLVGRGRLFLRVCILSHRSHPERIHELVNIVRTRVVSREYEQSP